MVYYIFRGIHKLHLRDDARYSDHSFVQGIGSYPIQDVEAIMMTIEPLVDYMGCVHMEAYFKLNHVTLVG